MSIYGELKTDSGNSYVEGIIEDITERKHSEEMLILSERMAAVGTMASGVAHEFNNIHAGVLGYSDLGARLEDIPETARTYFETIHSASLRARDLTMNLLSCTNQQTSKIQPAYLNATTRESFALVERELIKDGVQVECDFGDVPYVMMDWAQVGQVVLNFLINAHHSMIGRPEKKIRITTGVTGSEAWVKVEDSGCGIPEDKLQKIFTPFFSTKGEHADSGSSQASVSGTGLGLSVCHTIATNHKGRIEVDSEVGVGSTFTLYLPLSDDGEKISPQKFEKSQNNAEPGQAGRVLVIDDEENIRELISQVLTRQGCQVITTDDGNEAMKIIREEGVELVLLDLQMPKMSGSEFLGQLEKMEEGDRPVVIVVTGKVVDDMERIREDLNVYGSLAKPFSVDELQSLVNSAIKQHRAGLDS